MSAMRPPEPLTTFDAVLDLYLHLYVSQDLPNEAYRRRIWDANPDGWTSGPEHRQTLVDLLIAFAVRDRSAVAA